MEDIFKTSFINFLQTLNVDFVEYENVFSFKERNFGIVLIYAMQCSNEINNKLITCNIDLLYLYEDRWWHSKELVQERIMTRIGRFTSIFARKCTILNGGEFLNLKGNNCSVLDLVQHFLEKYHTYGDAKSKYKYALIYNNEVVAVASFSQYRPMRRSVNNPFANIPKENVSSDIVMIKSYEWVRYASLPNIRVVGGMGKLLKAFITEIKNGDIEQVEVMTYSDNEWSAGTVYEKLGFTFVGEKSKVLYYVNRNSYKRLSERKLLTEYNSLNKQITEEKIEKVAQLPQSFLSNYYKIYNMGSRKFLMKE
ncbi:MAG: hypothetical protein RSE02_08050 [Bacteroidales bacterium]